MKGQLIATQKRNLSAHSQEIFVFEIVAQRVLCFPDFAGNPLYLLKID